MTDVRLRDKAIRALEAAKRALASQDTETAADRAYYAVYYAAWAMLDAKGVSRPKTHHGLIAEFSRHFVKDGPYAPEQGAVLSRLENLRLAADYTLEPIPQGDAERAVSLGLLRYWGMSKCCTGRWQKARPDPRGLLLCAPEPKR